MPKIPDLPGGEKTGILSDDDEMIVETVSPSRSTGFAKVSTLKGTFLNFTPKTITNQNSTVAFGEVALVTCSDNNYTLTLPTPTAADAGKCLAIVGVQLVPAAPEDDTNWDLIITDGTWTDRLSDDKQAWIMLTDGVTWYKLSNPVGGFVRSGDEFTELDFTLLGARAGRDVPLDGSITDVTLIGTNAGRANTGDHPTFIGEDAGEENTGDSVTGIGEDAARRNSGDLVMAFGRDACWNNSGSYTIGMGQRACRDNSGLDALGFGRFALANNTGRAAVGLGHAAGQNNTGERAVCIGEYSGYFNTLGYKLIVGASASAPVDEAASDAAATILGDMQNRWLKFQAQLEVQHQLKQKFTVQAAGMTMSATNPRIIATGSAQTYNLWASPADGDTAVVKNLSGGAVTVGGNGSDIEDISADFTLNSSESATFTYVSGLTSWVVI